ncbi:MAG: helix-turn-helix transcriptional regulator [Duncaniella sp.]|nr:helix-turn-helix transcriptional regulator [Duncaniella sp.]
MKKLTSQENLEKYQNIAECPVRNVIARFSGKWSILILCVLDENDVARFKTLSNAIPDISPKVLTDTLKGLEHDGLISRRLYAEIPPRVEYSLTEMGRSLMPHIKALIGWALDNYSSFPKK